MTKSKHQKNEKHSLLSGKPPSELIQMLLNLMRREELHILFLLMVLYQLTEML